MKVPLTVGDFIDRAAHVYPDRPALIDEPDQPAPSWGTLSYGEVAARTRALAASLDRLGLGTGERVAIVSHNAARLVTTMLGVSAAGRISVPVNFRLNTAEVDYIVSHCGARMLLIDPELTDDLAGVDCEHRFIIGSEADEALFAGSDVEPRPWEPDEDATAAINYTSGTTAR
ncbi:MAG: AMP-binding protein, partial [bacterium]|nr:AMP-binding protein [bacterium]